jgi:hypothetical protein
LYLATVFQHHARKSSSPSQCHKTRKENVNNFQIRNEDINLPLFAGDMIAYVEIYQNRLKLKKKQTKNQRHFETNKSLSQG